MNKVHSESWSSTRVSPSLVAATTTLQNFALACFGASLPSFHNTLFCFVKYSSFMSFPRTKAACQSQLIHSPHRLFTQTWSSCRLSSFPFKIVHFWRATSLASKNCAILSGSLLGSRITQSCLPTLPAGFCWVWSLIIFCIQRFQLYVYPRKIVHPSM